MTTSDRTDPSADADRGADPTEGSAADGQATAAKSKKGRGAGFALDVGKLVTGTTIAQILTVAASPLLTRLYGPDAFGVWAVFTSIVGIITVVACLRYELAIMLPEDEQEAAHLLWLSVFSAAAMAVIAALVMVFGGSLITGWLSAPTLRSYLWLAPIMVFLGGLFSALNYWNSRTRKYGRLSIARVSASGTTLAAQLGGGYAGQTGGGMLILAGLAGSTVSTGVLAGQIWRDDRVLLRKGLSLRGMMAGAGRYRKFPLFSTWSALMNNLSWQLPAFMLSGFFSTGVVGFYALGYRVLSMPMSLLGGAISQVFFQRAARAENEGKLDELVEAVFERLVVYGVFPFMVLAVIGGNLFGLVFGSKWVEAGVYAQILAPWTILWFVSSPMTAVLAVLERQGLGLMINSVILATRFGSLLLGGLVGMARVGLIAFSASGVLVYGALCLIILRLSGVSVIRGLIVLATSVIYSLPAVALLVGLVLARVSVVVQVMVAVVAFIVFYAVMVRRDPVMRDIMMSWKRNEASSDD